MSDNRPSNPADLPIPGKIKSGYEGRRCALSDCRVDLTADTEAYLFRVEQTGQMAILCGICMMRAELDPSLGLTRIRL